MDTHTLLQIGLTEILRSQKSEAMHLKSEYFELLKFLSRLAEAQEDKEKKSTDTLWSLDNYPW